MEAKDIVKMAIGLMIGFILFITLFSMMGEAAREIGKAKASANYSATEQYCTVEDKYTDVVMVGNVATTEHYLDVYVSDAEELEGSVLVSSSMYNSIEEGSEIKCVLYHNDEGLVDIELAK